MRVRAELTLFAGYDRRTVPISSGYRPVFGNVMTDSLASGSIELMDREEMFPGEHAVVIIDFLIFSGSLPVGRKMTFSEGRHCLGEATVIETLSD